MSSESPPLFEDPAGTWNARYEGEAFRFGTTPNVWLSRHGDLFRAGQRVLCVADGEGRNSVWLAGRGLHVDAFDIAAVGVDKARRLASDHGVSVNYTVSDCDSYAWPPEHYDAVVVIFIQFADPAMRARIFANVKRCLKPGGIVALQGYATKQLEYGTGGPPRVSHLYSEAMLREAFSDFEIVELQEYEDLLAEGTAHCGRSALMGLVARRPR